jgi:hypothetical protein
MTKFKEGDFVTHKKTLNSGVVKAVLPDDMIEVSWFDEETTETLRKDELKKAERDA